MSLHVNEASEIESNWERFCPLIIEEANNGKTRSAIFKLISRGVETKGADWMYDLSEVNLAKKIAYLLEDSTIGNKDITYQNNIQSNSDSANNLKHCFKKEYEKENLITVAFRPYSKMYFYFDEYFINDTYQWLKIFKKNNSNTFIAINSPGNSQDFFCLTADTICDVHFTGVSSCIPLYWFSNEGSRQDNITDWAVQLFNDHYRQSEPASSVCYAGSSELRDEFRLDIPVVNPITKEAIFHYVYAVLHYPAYRKKYALNLKHEFPRIPLYNNFQQWSSWGKMLMDLHISYEDVRPYPLERKDVVIEPNEGMNLDNFFKARLKAHKEEGKIYIDAFTTLSHIPKTAWDYKLGKCSALEWVLDQYKEKKPSDPTIAEQFNTYRFMDNKELVIELLKRVCTVSVETKGIVGEMRE
jgi:predicted helicase